MKQKLLSLFAACVLSLGHAVAGDVLTVSEVNMMYGGQELLELECNFETTFTAFELEMVLPSGLRLMTSDEGKPRIQRGFNGNHVLSGSQIADGVYKFTCYSMSNSALPKSGILMSVMVQTDEQTPKEQGLQGCIRNIEFTRQSDYEGVILTDVSVVFNVYQNLIVDQRIYLRNVATGKFWGAANAWGTQASLVDEYQYVTLSQFSDGTFSMETMVTNGGENNYYNDSGYMDSGMSPLTIEMSAQGCYTVSTGKGYCGWDGQTTVLSNTLQAEDPNALWRIMTEEDVLAEQTALLNSATKDHPVDATFLIKDAGFDRNRRDATEAWNSEADHIVIGGPNENVRNYCSESYHSAFRLLQTISNVPKGVYKLTVQGFYRQDGQDVFSLPYFFMNDEQCQFPLLMGTENSMTSAGEAFANGFYHSEPMYVRLSETGLLTVGAELRENTGLWCIWDNFRLTYYGPDATVDEVKNGDHQQDDDNIRQWAEKTLASMKQLTEETNFYTEAARRDYYDQWAEKFEAGTLSDAEALSLKDPYTVTEWRANHTVDDLLMSVWDASPEAWDGYYVNTWSTEGENDGTDFRVPFIEYWTENTNRLAEKTLTAMLEGLQPFGTYDVSAWVRVRISDGVATSPTGVVMQVGNGQAADVSAGKQVEASQLYIGRYVASGAADGNGRLTVKIVVSADNNINWLAFKNLRYAYNGQATPVGMGFTDVKPFDVYTTTGIKVRQQTTTLKALSKGVYVIDGQKVAVK